MKHLYSTIMHCSLWKCNPKVCKHPQACKSNTCEHPQECPRCDSKNIRLDYYLFHCNICSNRDEYYHGKYAGLSKTYRDYCRKCKGIECFMVEKFVYECFNRRCGNRWQEFAKLYAKLRCLKARRLNYSINLEELCREAFKPSRIEYQYLIDPDYDE